MFKRAGISRKNVLNGFGGHGGFIIDLNTFNKRITHGMDPTLYGLAKSYKLTFRRARNGEWMAIKTKPFAIEARGETKLDAALGAVKAFHKERVFRGIMRLREEGVSNGNVSRI